MAEGLTGMLGGLLGGSGGNVAQSLLKLTQSQGGGLGELVSKFTGSGDAAVAGKAQSWVGTGANEPISGEQVEHTLGSDAVAFFFQAEDGIRDGHVTGVQTCALPI